MNLLDFSTAAVYDKCSQVFLLHFEASMRLPDADSSM